MSALQECTSGSRTLHQLAKECEEAGSTQRAHKLHQQNIVRQGDAEVIDGTISLLAQERQSVGLEQC